MADRELIAAIKNSDPDKVDSIIRAHPGLLYTNVQYVLPLPFPRQFPDNNIEEFARDPIDLAIRAVSFPCVEKLVKLADLRKEDPKIPYYLKQAGAVMSIVYDKLPERKGEIVRIYTVFAVPSSGLPNPPYVKAREVNIMKDLVQYSDIGEMRKTFTEHPSWIRWLDMGTKKVSVLNMAILRNKHKVVELLVELDAPITDEHVEKAKKEVESANALNVEDFPDSAENAKKVYTLLSETLQKRRTPGPEPERIPIGTPVAPFVEPEADRLEREEAEAEPDDDDSDDEGSEIEYNPDTDIIEPDMSAFPEVPPVTLPAPTTVHYKESAVPKALDIVMNEDTDIPALIADGSIVFKLKDNYVATDIEALRRELKEKTSTFFECKEKLSGSASPGKVHTDKPYFRIRLNGNFHVPEAEIVAALASPHKVFEIVKNEAKTIPYLTSFSSIMVKNGRDGLGRWVNIVSSDHCQEGTQQVTYNLRPVELVKDPAGGKRRKTYRNIKRSKKSRRQISGAMVMAIPNPATWPRLQDIHDQLNAAKGVGELDNVASDIQELGNENNDPLIFAGESGQRALRMLNEVIRNKTTWEESKIKDYLKAVLKDIGRVLEARAPPGGRRRTRHVKKSRRKTYRKSRKSRR